MLNILLVDSELETIPSEMLNDPGIRKYASTRKKKVQQLLLDSNYVHSSIDRFYPGMSSRRGRPDIVHTFLNVVNDSILNRKGLLRIFIHTRNNSVISVNPETRIPKSYNRFVGLMEDLFIKGEIKADGKVLLGLENLTAQEMIQKYSSGRKVVMWPAGSRTPLNRIVEDEDTTVIIGGFAEGDFLSNLSGIEDKYSIFDEELTIWTVASELICAYENIHNVL